jgi:hypothetical protein
MQARSEKFQTCSTITEHTIPNFPHTGAIDPAQTGHTRRQTDRKNHTDLKQNEISTDFREI